MGPRIETPFTKQLGCERPILLAGMNVAAGPELAAAVSNNGGLGVIGGLGYSPDQLRKQIREVKENLVKPDLPFGVDLLIPQVGGDNARKTNYDYTGGQLEALVDVIIEEKTKLFVCAVGVPPKAVVEKLHKAGIFVQNMVGHPKHVKKALDVGVDIICCQGGGHTGDTPTFLLIPACVEICKGRTSPMTGKPIQVIAAGGIYDGKGLAAALAFGATAVWVGTRFVAAEEAGASPVHQEKVVSAGWGDTIRSIIFTGRPLRVRNEDYIQDWEDNRQAEIKKLTSNGKIPVGMEDPEHRPYLMGTVAALIQDVQPAKKIMDDMISVAYDSLKRSASYAKL